MVADKVGRVRGRQNQISKHSDLVLRAALSGEVPPTSELLVDASEVSREMIMIRVMAK